MTLKRQYFTVLEMLITIMLIAIITSIIGINIFRILSQEKFHTAINDISNKIKMAQKFSIGLNIDNTLKIYQEGDCFFIALDIEENTKNKRFLAKPVKLKGLCDIKFENKELPLELKFFSSGGKMPRGTLKLSGSRECCYINLYEHYHPIEIFSKPHLIEEHLEGNDLFPHDIYEKKTA